MGNIDKVDLRRRIEAEILKTEQRIQDYEEMSEPVSPDDAIGRVSRMDAINNKSVTESALRQAKDKLSKLRHAIAQIEEPGFGTCRRCSQPIPVMRVVLMPESPYCVRCAQ
jgi:DnaK suppressor protein